MNYAAVKRGEAMKPFTDFLWKILPGGKDREHRREAASRASIMMSGILADVRAQNDRVEREIKRSEASTRQHPGQR